MDNWLHMESVGTLLSRIHQIGAKQTFTHRPQINLEEYLYQPKECLLTSEYIPKAIMSDLQIILTRLITITEHYWHTDWQVIRLHADCHGGNILWNDGPILVDFDDARNGPAIQDLWMLLYGDNQEQRLQLDMIIEMYQEFYNFDTKQLQLIEPLRAMRMVHHLAWVVERWQDPAFPLAFPWLTNLDFWSKQLTLFDQQITAIQSPPLQLIANL